MAVMPGLFFGICMGVGFYLLTPSRSAVGAAVGGAIFGVGFGTVMAASPSGGGWLRIKELAALPPSGRVAVLRAVRRGEPVTDPRLASGVLAYAEVVIASVRKQIDRHVHWWLFGFAALELVMAVQETNAGPAWLAMLLWVSAAMFLTIAWRLPGTLDRQGANARAAAALAAAQMGHSSAD